MTEVIDNSTEIYQPTQRNTLVCTLKHVEYKYLIDRNDWILSTIVLKITDRAIQSL